MTVGKIISSPSNPDQAQLASFICLEVTIKNVRASLFRNLKQIARQVWMAVTPQYLEKLYKSMPLGMQAVVAQQGGHTKH